MLLLFGFAVLILGRGPKGVNRLLENECPRHFQTGKMMAMGLNVKIFQWNLFWKLSLL